MPTRKPGHASVVLLLDSSDRFGYAATDSLDRPALARIVANLRACFPRQPVRVSRGTPGTDSLPPDVLLGHDGSPTWPARGAGPILTWRPVRSPFFTDAKRLRSLAFLRGAFMVVAGRQPCSFQPTCSAPRWIARGRIVWTSRWWMASLQRLFM